MKKPFIKKSFKNDSKGYKGKTSKFGKSKNNSKNTYPSK